MAAAVVTRLADHVVRLGTWVVNWYLIEYGGRITVVDAAVPAYLPQIDRGLALLGKGRSDVEAVVLTHAHADHVGVAELLRSELHVPVYVHEDDERLARTAKAFGKNDGSMLPYLRYPMAYRLLFELGKSGGMKPRPIAEVQTYTDGAELPGGLRAIHTPGHSDGHCALVAGEVMFTGDALCTLNPLTGKRGPELMPTALNRSTAAAAASLNRLAGTGATLVLPGHGDPWPNADDAVARAKAAGPT
jgi:glyoxylase-like metal-dependent hydrolase (beta-lactamase superfamily II)